MAIMVPEDVVKLAVRWMNNTYTAFPGDRWDTGEVRDKMMDISTIVGRYSFRSQTRFWAADMFEPARD